MSARIAILTYHSLDESGSVLSVPPAAFAEQMAALHELGVSVIPLEEVSTGLDGSPSMKPRVAITFDDGFQNIHQPLVEARERYGFPITVFLVTDHCDRDSAWPGQPPEIRPQPLLRWNDVRELDQAGVGFGSHTRTHPDLTSIQREEAEEQLLSSKKAIEDAIGKPVTTHAYPYGAHDGAVRKLVSRHFRLACSTRLAFVRPGSDPFALERLDMYYLRSPRRFRRLFSADMNAYIGLRRLLREIRGWGGRTAHGG